MAGYGFTGRNPNDVLEFSVQELETACKVTMSEEYCKSTSEKLQQQRFVQQTDWDTLDSDCELHAPFAEKLMPALANINRTIQAMQLVLEVMYKRTAEIKYISNNLKKHQFKNEELIYEKMIKDLINSQIAVLTKCIPRLREIIEANE